MEIVLHEVTYKFVGRIAFGQRESQAQLVNFQSHGHRSIQVRELEELQGVSIGGHLEGFWFAKHVELSNESMHVEKPLEKCGLKRMFISRLLSILAVYQR